MLVRLPHLFLVLSLLLTTAKAEEDYEPDFTYTKISYTTKTHKPCINDCVQGRCAGWSGFYYYSFNCTPGDEIAPIYHTPSSETKRRTCLSRCDDHGYGYKWCYVDNNENWDYCSSQTRTTLVEAQVTLKGDQCVTECTNTDSDMYMCFDRDIHKQECNPRKVAVIQGYTIYGDKCIGKCEKNKHTNHHFCRIRTAFGGTVSQDCAPNAQPNLPAIFGTLYVPDCKKGKLEECFLNKTVDIIEKAPYFETFKVDEANNPVKSYTVKHEEERVGTNLKMLPLVIRAILTKQTLRPVDGVTVPDMRLSDSYYNAYLMKKHDDDVPVSLISYRMGGKNETYNVIPVHASVKEKIVDLQDFICDVLVANYEEVVNVTVLVTYTSDKKVDAIIYSMDHSSFGEFDMNYLKYFENKKS